jgi:hypothetical protein
MNLYMKETWVRSLCILFIAWYDHGTRNWVVYYLLRKLGEAGGEGCICMVGTGLCVGASGGGIGVVCSSLIFLDGVTGCGGT